MKNPRKQGIPIPAPPPIPQAPPIQPIGPPGTLPGQKPAPPIQLNVPQAPPNLQMPAGMQPPAPPQIAMPQMPSILGKNALATQTNPFSQEIMREIGLGMGHAIATKMGIPTAGGSTALTPQEQGMNDALREKAKLDAENQLGIAPAAKASKGPLYDPKLVNPENWFPRTVDGVASYLAQNGVTSIPQSAVQYIFDQSAGNLGKSFWTNVDQWYQVYQLGQGSSGAPGSPGNPGANASQPQAAGPAMQVNPDGTLSQISPSANPAASGLYPTVTPAQPAQNTAQANALSGNSEIMPPATPTGASLAANAYSTLYGGKDFSPGFTPTSTDDPMWGVTDQNGKIIGPGDVAARQKALDAQQQQAAQQQAANQTVGYDPSKAQPPGLVQQLAQHAFNVFGGMGSMQMARETAQSIGKIASTTADRAGSLPLIGGAMKSTLKLGAAVPGLAFGEEAGMDAPGLLSKQIKLGPVSPDIWSIASLVLPVAAEAGVPGAKETLDAVNQVGQPILGPLGDSIHRMWAQTYLRSIDQDNASGMKAIQPGSDLDKWWRQENQKHGVSNTRPGTRQLTPQEKAAAYANYDVAFNSNRDEASMQYLDNVWNALSQKDPLQMSALDTLSWLALGEGFKLPGRALSDLGILHDSTAKPAPGVAVGPMPGPADTSLAGQLRSMRNQDPRAPLGPGYDQGGIPTDWQTNRAPLLAKRNPATGDLVPNSQFQDLLRLQRGVMNERDDLATNVNISPSTRRYRQAALQTDRGQLLADLTDMNVPAEQAQRFLNGEDVFSYNWQFQNLSQMPQDWFTPPPATPPGPTPPRTGPAAPGNRTGTPPPTNTRPSPTAPGGPTSLDDSMVPRDPVSGAELPAATVQGLTTERNDLSNRWNDVQRRLQADPNDAAARSARNQLISARTDLANRLNTQGIPQPMIDEFLQGQEIFDESWQNDYANRTGGTRPPLQRSTPAPTGNAPTLSPNPNVSDQVFEALVNGTGATDTEPLTVRVNGQDVSPMGVQPDNSGLVVEMADGTQPTIPWEQVESVDRGATNYYTRSTPTPATGNAPIVPPAPSAAPPTPAPAPAPSSPPTRTYRMITDALQRGEQITPEEQAFLDRLSAAQRRRAQRSGATPPSAPPAEPDATPPEVTPTNPPPEATPPPSAPPESTPPEATPRSDDDLVDRVAALPPYEYNMVVPNSRAASYYGEIATKVTRGQPLTPTEREWLRKLGEGFSAPPPRDYVWPRPQETPPANPTPPVPLAQNAASAPGAPGQPPTPPEDQESGRDRMARELLGRFTPERLARLAPDERAAVQAILDRGAPLSSVDLSRLASALQLINARTEAPPIPERPEQPTAPINPASSTPDLPSEAEQTPATEPVRPPEPTPVEDDAQQAIIAARNTDPSQIEAAVPWDFRDSFWRGRERQLENQGQITYAPNDTGTSPAVVGARLAFLRQQTELYGYRISDWQRDSNTGFFASLVGRMTDQERTARVVLFADNQLADPRRLAELAMRGAVRVDLPSLRTNLLAALRGSDKTYYVPPGLMRGAPEEATERLAIRTKVANELGFQVSVWGYDPQRDAYKITALADAGLGPQPTTEPGTREGDFGEEPQGRPTSSMTNVTPADFPDEAVRGGGQSLGAPDLPEEIPTNRGSTSGRPDGAEFPDEDTRARPRSTLAPPEMPEETPAARREDSTLSETPREEPAPLSEEPATPRTANIGDSFEWQNLNGRFSGTYEIKGITDTSVIYGRPGGPTIGEASRSQFEQDTGLSVAEAGRPDPALRDLREPPPGQFQEWLRAQPNALPSNPEYDAGQAAQWAIRFFNQLPFEDLVNEHRDLLRRINWTFREQESVQDGLERGFLQIAGNQDDPRRTAAQMAWQTERARQLGYIVNDDFWRARRGILTNPVEKRQDVPPPPPPAPEYPGYGLQTSEVKAGDILEEFGTGQRFFVRSEANPDDSYGVLGVWSRSPGEGVSLQPDQLARMRKFVDRPEPMMTRDQREILVDQIRNAIPNWTQGVDNVRFTPDRPISFRVDDYEPNMGGTWEERRAYIEDAAEKQGYRITWGPLTEEGRRADLTELPNRNQGLTSDDLYAEFALQHPGWATGYTDTLAKKYPGESFSTYTDTNIAGQHAYLEKEAGKLNRRIEWESDEVGILRRVGGQELEDRPLGPGEAYHPISGMQVMPGQIIGSTTSRVANSWLKNVRRMLGNSQSEGGFLPKGATRGYVSVRGLQPGAILHGAHKLVGMEGKFKEGFWRIIDLDQRGILVKKITETEATALARQGFPRPSLEEMNGGSRTTPPAATGAETGDGSPPIARAPSAEGPAQRPAQSAGQPAGRPGVPPVERGAVPGEADRQPLEEQRPPDVPGTPGRREPGANGDNPGRIDNPPGPQSQPNGSGSLGGVGRSDAGSSPDAQVTAPNAGAVPEFNLQGVQEIYDRRGADQRVNDNLNAIELFLRLREQERAATPEELAILAKYSGWGDSQYEYLFKAKGPLDAPLRDRNGNPRRRGRSEEPPPPTPDQQRYSRFQGLMERIGEVMGSQVERDLRDSRRTAFFTPSDVVNAMWGAIGRIGANDTARLRVLEPAAGIGRFLGLMPDALRGKADRTAVEMETFSAEFTKMLYPGAEVHNLRYQEARLPDNFYDLAISNVPFNRNPVFDQTAKYREKTNRFLSADLHGYYFAKTLDKIRPGGVIAFITSHNSLDASDAGQLRRYLAENADLLGAFRLPANAFKDTSVTTDIIFLRKRIPGEPPANDPKTGKPPAWDKAVQVAIDANGAITPSSQRMRLGDRQEAIYVNEYFLEHPENVLGKHSTEGTMYHPNEYTLLKEPGVDVVERLQQRLASLPAGVFRDVRPEDDIPRSQEAPLDSAKDGSFAVQNGKVVRKYGDQWVEPQLFNVTDPARRAEGLLKIRDAARLLQAYQRDDKETALIENAQEELRNAYTDFVTKYGALHSDVNKRLIGEDPDRNFLMAVERWSDELKDRFGTGKNKPTEADLAIQTNPDGKISSPMMADFMLKRTISPTKEISRADTARDALNISMSQAGRIDWDRMEALTGKRPGDLQSELGDLVYQDPSFGWQIAEQYLSGDVREKYAVAQAAAARDPKFQRNVEALQRALPRWVAAKDIGIPIFAPWVPIEYVEQFTRDVLKMTTRDGYQRTDDPFLKYNTVMSLFSFTRGVDRNERTSFTHTVIPDQELLLDVLNDKKTTVYVEDDNGNRVRDEQLTKQVEAKKNLIRQAWRQWVWGDQTRKDALEVAYNEKFNNLVRAEYNPDHIRNPALPEGVMQGQNPAIKLRRHQLTAISRIIREGTALLAHEVGFGKTFTMIASGMELKRLGLAKKPMYVVPKALLGQMENAFRELYPGANLLVPSEQDFVTDNRREFLNQTATNDWDGVIVSYEQFAKLDLKPENRRRYLQEEVQKLESALRAEQQDAEDEGRSRFRKSYNEKAIQNRLDTMTTRLQKLDYAIKEGIQQDVGLYWEDLGVDQLFVDEAHNYKNLWFPTNKTRIKGLPNAHAERSLDMSMKTRQLQERQNGRGVVFATGTPIANSIAELWTMLRYLVPQKMDQLGIGTFDQFAANFGRMVTDPVMKVDGTVEQETRFKKFLNVPELSQIFQTVADIRRTKDSPEMELLKPRLQGGRRITVTAKKTAAFELFMMQVTARMAELRSGQVDPKVDNHLKLAGDARKGSLDIRLIDRSAPDDPQSKVNLLVSQVANIYQTENSNKGTQLVFLDLGTPKATDTATTAAPRAEGESDELSDDGAVQENAEEQTLTTSVYQDIKKKLIAEGIPANEIAFASDAKNKAQQADMYRRVNLGEIRVLIGSTAKLGAGVNVQERLAALHHLDQPWRPADWEQREGRILRPGNIVYGPKFDREGNRTDPGKGVQIYQYATEKSYDVVMLGKLITKLEGINQIMGRDPTDREIEEIDPVQLDWTDAQAQALDDPLIMDARTVNDKVNQYGALYRSVEEEKQDRARDAEMKDATANAFEQDLIPKYEAYRTAWQQAGGESGLTGRFSVPGEGNEPMEITDANSLYEAVLKRVELSEDYFNQRAQALPDPGWNKQVLGRVNGFMVEMGISWTTAPHAKEWRDRFAPQGMYEGRVYTFSLITPDGNRVSSPGSTVAVQGPLPQVDWGAKLSDAANWNRLIQNTRADITELRATAQRQRDIIPTIEFPNAPLFAKLVQAKRSMDAHFSGQVRLPPEVARDLSRSLKNLLDDQDAQLPELPPIPDRQSSGASTGEAVLSDDENDPNQLGTRELYGGLPVPAMVQFALRHRTLTGIALIAGGFAGLGAYQRNQGDNQDLSNNPTINAILRAGNGVIQIGDILRGMNEYNKDILPVSAELVAEAVELPASGMAKLLGIPHAKPGFFNPDQPAAFQGVNLSAPNETVKALQDNWAKRSAQAPALAFLTTLVADPLNWIGFGEGEVTADAYHAASNPVTRNSGTIFTRLSTAARHEQDAQDMGTLIFREMGGSNGDPGRTLRAIDQVMKSGTATEDQLRLARLFGTQREIGVSEVRTLQSRMGILNPVDPTTEQLNAIRSMVQGDAPGKGITRFSSDQIRWLAREFNPEFSRWTGARRLMRLDKMQEWASRYGLPDLNNAIERADKYNAKDWVKTTVFRARQVLTKEPDPIREAIQNLPFARNLLRSYDKMAPGLNAINRQVNLPILLSFLASPGWVLHSATELALRSWRGTESLSPATRFFGQSAKALVTERGNLAERLAQTPWYHDLSAARERLMNYYQGETLEGRGGLAHAPFENNALSKSWLPLIGGQPNHWAAEAIRAGDPASPVYNTVANVVDKLHLGTLYGGEQYIIGNLEGAFRTYWIAQEHEQVLPQVLRRMGGEAQRAQSVVNDLLKNPEGVRPETWARVRPQIQSALPRGNVSQLVDDAVRGRIDRLGLAQMIYQEAQGAVPMPALAEWNAVMRLATPEERDAFFAAGGSAERQVEAALQFTYGNQIRPMLDEVWQRNQGMLDELRTLNPTQPRMRDYNLTTAEGNQTYRDAMANYYSQTTRRARIVRQVWGDLEARIQDSVAATDNLWDWAFYIRRGMSRDQEGALFDQVRRTRQTWMSLQNNETRYARQMFEQRIRTTRGIATMPREVLDLEDQIFGMRMEAFQEEDRLMTEFWAGARSGGFNRNAYGQARDRIQTIWNDYRDVRNDLEEDKYRVMEDFYNRQGGRPGAPGDNFPVQAPPVRDVTTEQRNQANQALERVRGQLQNYTQRVTIQTDEAQALRRWAQDAEQKLAQIPGVGQTLEKANQATARIVADRANQHFVDHLNRTQFDEIARKFIPFWMYDWHGGQFYLWMAGHVPGLWTGSDRLATMSNGTGNLQGGMNPFEASGAADPSNNFGAFGNQLAPMRGLWPSRFITFAKTLQASRPQSVKDVANIVMQQGLVGAQVPPTAQFAYNAANGNGFDLPPALSEMSDAATIAGAHFPLRTSDKFLQYNISLELAGKGIDPQNPTPEQRADAERAVAVRDFSQSLVPRFTYTTPQKLEEQKDFQDALAKLGISKANQADVISQGYSPWALLDAQQKRGLMQDHPDWQYLFEASDALKTPEEQVAAKNLTTLLRESQRISADRLSQQQTDDAALQSGSITAQAWMDNHTKRAANVQGQRNELDRLYANAKKVLDDPTRRMLLTPEDQAVQDYYAKQGDLITANTVGDQINWLAVDQGTQAYLAGLSPQVGQYVNQEITKNQTPMEQEWHAALSAYAQYKQLPAYLGVPPNVTQQIQDQNAAYKRLQSTSPQAALVYRMQHPLLTKRFPRNPARDSFLLQQPLLTKWFVSPSAQLLKRMSAQENYVNGNEPVQAPWDPAPQNTSSQPALAGVQ